MLKKTSVALSLVLALSACTAPTVVQKRQVGDNNMNCMELRNAILDAEEFEGKARGAKGATAENIAAYVFFWPAMFVNYANAEEAQVAARERRDNLTRIADQKGCRAF